jgi:hypothetical protein
MQNGQRLAPAAASVVAPSSGRVDDLGEHAVDDFRGHQCR